MSVVEHIVLLNVKPDVDSTKVETMIEEIHGLASLNLTVHLRAGPLLQCRCSSTSLNFSHIVYGRFSSTDDLEVYNHHPDHMHVYKYTQQLIDDIMVVDWMSNGISDPLKPGSVMRVTLLKLKADLDENEKGKVVEETISELKLKTSEHMISVGECLSHEMAKGYSIGVITSFPDLEAVDADAELANLHSLKAKDFIESEVVVDYVVPLP